jgi:4'-phosphopantetheinyl transferase
VSSPVAVRWAPVGLARRPGGLALLDPEERRRAARIRHAGARARFVAGRATLRTLLGDLLGEAPAAVPLSVTPPGRPVLDAPAGWSVSLAHCPDLVVAAVGMDVEVGVDVERHDRLGLPPEARWCSPAELAACRAAPVHTRHLLLLRLWTGKEALAKMTVGGTELTFADLEIRELSGDGDAPDPGGAGEREPGLRWLALSPEHVVALATGPRAGRRRSAGGS